MLRHTFCHVPGIGPSREQQLWSRGIRTWDDVESAPYRGARAEQLRELIMRSTDALAAGDARFFSSAVPPREHWRLYPSFLGKVAYLDIETTGLGNYGDFITAIAVYDGRRVRTYVHGRNMDEFEADIAEYDLLVTFNGKGFDVPMIHRMLGVRLDHAHIDAMHVSRSIGLRGGLKAIERYLGYDRPDMADVDGFFAVLLWREYERTRDERVLETLLAYNVQDVLTLEPLMIHAFNAKVVATPFAELCIPKPALAENPFRAHREVIDAIRARYAPGGW